MESTLAHTSDVGECTLTVVGTRPEPRSLRSYSKAGYPTSCPKYLRTSLLSPWCCSSSSIPPSPPLFPIACKRCAPPGVLNPRLHLWKRLHHAQPSCAHACSISDRRRTTSRTPACDTLQSFISTGNVAALFSPLIALQSSIASITIPTPFDSRRRH